MRRGADAGKGLDGMPESNGDYNWDKHNEEHQRIWEMLRKLVDHAELTDERIDKLRASQAGLNEGIQSLVGAIRDLIDRIPPENLR